jgi:lipoyl(octanoyl) transferase
MVRRGEAGVLLLSEVAPVITVGRRTPQNHLLADASELGRAGIDRVDTDRGGLATYHGPGQWVMFPVERLERLTGDSCGVRKAVASLLRVASLVAEEFGVKTEIREGPELGVWTTGNGKPGKKVAAVGIHVDDGVLLHGLSLNVFRTHQSFSGLKPCGLEAGVDFIFSGETDEKNEAAFEQVKDALARNAVHELWGQTGSR